jgi:heterodisulfide reductase subunit A
VDVDVVAQYAATLPNVTLVENNLFACSTDTQTLISDKIKENGLNRIVIAACAPRTHEPLFQDTPRETGLNAHLVEMANIRNQNSRVHQKEPEKATEKAKDQVRMVVAQASAAYGLQSLSVDVVQKELVIGGGVSGMKAALTMAGQGFPVLLIEKTDRRSGCPGFLLDSAYAFDEKSKIDLYLPGCPPHSDQVFNALAALVGGKELDLPGKSVCDTCSTIREGKGQ